VYRDEESAKRRIEEPFPYVAPSFRPEGIGAESIAWLVAETNSGRVCPCELWLRVGPLVAAVTTSYDALRAAPEPDLEPVQRELAVILAERMAAAVESALD
jgi:hypothetical protein